MSERILIPLDGSKLGETAISYVDGLIARLAPEERIEIINKAIGTVMMDYPPKPTK